MRIDIEGGGELRVETNEGSLLINRYSIAEEIANSITHGIGIVFSIVALTMLLVYAISAGNVTKIVAFSVYGICSIALYCSSTLYHSFRIEKVKRVFRIFDHTSIFLYIAGCYTPIALLCMNKIWGIGILSTIWMMAAAGIGLKIFGKKKIEKYKIISVAIYILMGWLVAIASKPILMKMPMDFMYWLIGGGLFYTVGVVFYVVKKIPFNHAIWHVFVLGGSVTHFLAMFIYLR